IAQSFFAGGSGGEIVQDTICEMIDLKSKLVLCGLRAQGRFRGNMRGKTGFEGGGSGFVAHGRARYCSHASCSREA
ncbi:hypothetical protein, partial [Gluconobacter japonicus]|uniref:hypothetical protein n=1 Tax=Gluconobacter japonicus TaxID=376620 RepID=UPI001E659FDD